MNNYWLNENNEEQLNLKETILQATARGWCSSRNSHKTMDSELAEDIANEILKTIHEDVSGDSDAAFIDALKKLGDEEENDTDKFDKFFEITKEDIEFANSIGWFPNESIKSIDLLKVLCKDAIAEDKKHDIYEAIWDVFDTLLEETILPITDKTHEKTVILEQTILDNEIIHNERIASVYESLNAFREENMKLREENMKLCGYLDAISSKMLQDASKCIEGNRAS